LRWRTTANQYIRQCGYRVGILFWHRQDVVLVESGRYSRSAKFDTTSELIMFTESAV